jgi:hypothetical protein
MNKKARYRIKEYSLPYNRTEWVVQRRSIFGWWYNPDNIDGMTTGWYNTLKDAEKALEAKLHKTTSKVVKEVYF